MTRRVEEHELFDRFWSRVQVNGPDECWPWIGAIQGHGYGHFHIGLNRYRSPHVWFWEQVNGILLPAGYTLHQKCELKVCCNLRCLELLTRSEHQSIHIRARLGIDPDD